MTFEEAKKKLEELKSNSDKGSGHIFYLDMVKSVILQAVRDDFIGQFILFHQYTAEDYEKAIRELSDFLEDAGF